MRENVVGAWRDLRRGSPGRGRTQSISDDKIPVDNWFLDDDRNDRKSSTGNGNSSSRIIANGGFFERIWGSARTPAPGSRTSRPAAENKNHHIARSPGIRRGRPALRARRGRTFAA